MLFQMSFFTGVIAAREFGDMFHKIMSDSITESPQSPFHNHSIGGWITPEENRELFLVTPLKYISLVVNQLKSMVNETSFDLSRFRTESEILVSILFKASVLLERLSGPREDVLKVYTFASHMFLSMMDAEKQISDLQYKFDPQTKLISRIIELNVRSLVLMDCWGLPDFEIENIRSRTRTLSQNLTYWKLCFASIEHTSLKMRRTFQKHFDKVRKLIEFLELGIEAHDI